MEGVFTGNRESVIDYHLSVMPNEVIEQLRIKKGGKYIDCTLGGGGHTIELLKRGAVVLAIDQDEDAHRHFADLIQKNKIARGLIRNLTITRGNFQNLGKIARENGFFKTEGILFDLGVSTHQLKTPDRGFSFGADSDLDMRMDRSSGVSASEVVNKKSLKELYEIFTKYGEEKRAWAISEAILRARLVRPILKSKDLADLILKIRGRIGKFDKTHPATRVFQALRIYVNDELNCLKEALPQAVDLLRKNGRICVISFHSLEDRIVKNYFKTQQVLGVLKIPNKKPIRPTEKEIKNNASARSGKLRVGEKL